LFAFVVTLRLVAVVVVGLLRLVARVVYWWLLFPPTRCCVAPVLLFVPARVALILQLRFALLRFILYSFIWFPVLHRWFATLFALLVLSVTACAVRCWLVLFSVDYVVVRSRLVGCSLPFHSVLLVSFGLLPVVYGLRFPLFWFISLLLRFVPFVDCTFSRFSPFTDLHLFVRSTLVTFTFAFHALRCSFLRFRFGCLPGWIVARSALHPLIGFHCVPLFVCCSRWMFYKLRLLIRSVLLFLGLLTRFVARFCFNVFAFAVVRSPVVRFPTFVDYTLVLFSRSLLFVDSLLAVAYVRSVTFCCVFSSLFIHVCCFAVTFRRFRCLVTRHRFLLRWFTRSVVRVFG
jgi:hypothetical protein